MVFKHLIGLEENIARKLLKEIGYNYIETIKNSKHNELCDSLVVCAVRKDKNKITLVCGEFYLGIKE